MLGKGCWRYVWPGNMVAFLSGMLVNCFAVVEGLQPQNAFHAAIHKLPRQLSRQVLRPSYAS